MSKLLHLLALKVVGVVVGVAVGRGERIEDE